MTPSDDRRWWSGFIDLAEQRIRAVLAAHDATPIYDPTRPNLRTPGQKDLADGRACSKCRKVSRSDARICGSCGTLLRMTP